MLFKLNLFLIVVKFVYLFVDLISTLESYPSASFASLMIFFFLHILAAVPFFLLWFPVTHLTDFFAFAFIFCTSLGFPCFFSVFLRSCAEQEEKKRGKALLFSKAVAPLN